MRRAAPYLALALAACRGDLPDVAQAPADAAADARGDAPPPEAAAPPADAPPEAAPAPSQTTPAPPALEERTASDLKWPAPTNDDFALGTADEVSLARDRPGCSAHVLRGWLRLECRVDWPSITVLGGSRDGLYTIAEPDRAILILPLARGDRRVVQIAEAALGQRGNGMGAYETAARITPFAVVSESWVGTAGPVVTID